MITNYEDALAIINLAKRYGGQLRITRTGYQPSWEGELVLDAHSLAVTNSEEGPCRVVHLESFDGRMKLMLESDMILEAIIAKVKE